MHRVTSCLMAAGLAFLTASVGAREDTRSVQVNEDQVKRLNAFADKLHRLHQQQLQGRKIHETEQFGGYARLPEFYREVSYFDADSGRLLSRIQWERNAPERIHTIEVYVYDDRGRLARDYMAWFLPLTLLTIFRPNLEDRIALSVLGESWFRRRRPQLRRVDRAAFTVLR